MNAHMEPQVIKKAGMKQSALARLEKAGNPRTSTLKKLAEALNITVEQLID